MAKARSPNYPALSLREAVDAVRMIYKGEHKSKMDAAVAAQHMGHNSLNGRAAVKVSALRKYGLLDSEGRQLRVSNDAVTIIADPPESADRKQAITRTAFTPSLFSELRQEYPESKPSHSNLKSNLMKRGFTEEAALTASEKYLDTIDFVSEEGLGYNPPKEDLDTEDHMHEEMPERPAPPFEKPAASQWSWQWTLSIPRNVNAELRMSGPVSPRDFDLLKKQIETLEAAFGDQPQDGSGEVD